MFQTYQKDLVRKLSETISMTTKEKMLNVTGILKLSKDGWTNNKELP